MFEQRDHRRPWSELSVLALGAAAVLIAAAVAASLHSWQAWTLLAALTAAYALSRGAARGDWSAPGERPVRIRATLPATERPEVVASEEQLDVDKRSRPHERVRLRKEVVTEQVTITVPVRREVLRVERIPIEPGGAPPAESLTAFGTGETQELVLMEEQAVVDKRVVARERVRLAKDVVTEEQQITETVRREEVDVDRERPEPEQETP